MPFVRAELQRLLERASHVLGGPEEDAKFETLFSNSSDPANSWQDPKKIHRTRYTATGAKVFVKML